MADDFIFGLLEEMKDERVGKLPVGSKAGITKKKGKDDTPSRSKKGLNAHKKKTPVGDSKLWDDLYEMSEDEDDELFSCSQAARFGRRLGTGGMDDDGQGVSTSALVLEAQRWRAMSALAGKFKELSADILGKKWSRHFETWLFSARSTFESMGTPSSDPCLPSFHKRADGKVERIDKELHRKLVAAGATPDKADYICNELGRTCTKLHQGLTRNHSGGGKAAKITMQSIKMQMRETERVKLKLTCCGVSVEVNDEHYEKLRELYARTNDHDPTERELNSAMFRLLARYSSFQGAHYKAGGFQAAIHGECFDVLYDDFGCNLECFASPMNTRYSRFCSAHADTDMPFGSLGSFFAFHPKQGSFEANPPFDDVLIQRMSAHMTSLLSSSSLPLSFVIIIPYLPIQGGWRAVNMNKYKTHHLLLAQGEHGYFEGSQHDRMNRYRISVQDTSVFFVQNKAGAERWPVSNEKLERLKEAFKPKLMLNPNRAAEMAREMRDAENEEEDDEVDADEQDVTEESESAGSESGAEEDATAHALVQKNGNLQASEKKRKGSSEGQTAAKKAKHVDEGVNAKSHPIGASTRDTSNAERQKDARDSTKSNSKEKVRMGGVNKDRESHVKGDSVQKIKVKMSPGDASKLKVLPKEGKVPRVADSKMKINKVGRAGVKDFISVDSQIRSALLTAKRSVGDDEGDSDGGNQDQGAVKKIIKKKKQMAST